MTTLCLPESPSPDALKAHIRRTPGLRAELIALAQMREAREDRLSYLKAVLLGAAIHQQLKLEHHEIQHLAEATLKFAHAPERHDLGWQKSELTDDLKAERLQLRNLQRNTAFLRAAGLLHRSLPELPEQQQRHLLSFMLHGFLLADGYTRNIWVESEIGGLSFLVQHQH